MNDKIEFSYDIISTIQRPIVEKLIEIGRINTARLMYLFDKIRIQYESNFLHFGLYTISNIRDKSYFGTADEIYFMIGYDEVKNLYQIPLTNIRYTPIRKYARINTIVDMVRIMRLLNISTDSIFPTKVDTSRPSFIYNFLLEADDTEVLGIMSNLLNNMYKSYPTPGYYDTMLKKYFDSFEQSKIKMYDYARYINADPLLFSRKADIALLDVQGEEDELYRWE